MYARLGFAVAAHVDPDVLLVDEVLSVGDVAFQDRSIRKMLSFRDAGRAILFVSHNLSAVEMMCQRAVWLDHGQVRLAGPTAGGGARVSGRGRRSAGRSRGGDCGDDAEAVSEVDAVHRRGQRARPTSSLAMPLRVRLRCLVARDVRQVQCSVTVRGDYGPLFSATSEPAARWAGGLARAGVHLRQSAAAARAVSGGRAACAMPTPAWALPQTVAAFRVETDLAEFGSDSVVGATKSRGGFLAVAYDWRVHIERAASRLWPGCDCRLA